MNPIEQSLTKAELHVAGGNYEAFLKRAFNCDYDRKGVKDSYFIYLLEMKMGKKFSTLPKYDTYFLQIKGYLSEGIDAFLKKGITKSESTRLLSVKELIIKAKNGQELVLLVEDLERATRKYKDHTRLI